MKRHIIQLCKEWNSGLLPGEKKLTPKEYVALVADIVKRAKKDYKGVDKIFIDLT